MGVVNSGGININASGQGATGAAAGGNTDDILIAHNSITIIAGIGINFNPLWAKSSGNASVSNFRCVDNKLTYTGGLTGNNAVAFDLRGQVSNGVVSGNVIENCGIGTISGVAGLSYTTGIVLTPTSGSATVSILVPNSAEVMSSFLTIYFLTGVTVGGVVIPNFATFAITGVSGDTMTFSLGSNASNSTPVNYSGTLEMLHGATHAVRVDGNQWINPNPVSPQAVIQLNGRGVAASGNTIIGTGTNWGALLSNTGFMPANQTYGDVVPAVFSANYGPTGTGSLGNGMDSGNGRVQWASLYGNALAVDTDTTGSKLGYFGTGTTQFNVSAAGVITASALATGGTTARTLAAIFADQNNVKSFGAVGDTRNAACTVTCTTASTTINTVESLFAATDVGKRIAILITSGSVSLLSIGTSITGYTSPTQITVSAVPLANETGAAGTVVWGTSDITPLTNAATPKYLPNGAFNTGAGISTLPAGRWYNAGGPGRLVTIDSGVAHYSAGNVSIINAPISTNPSYSQSSQTSAFDADISQIALAAATRISGTNTLGDLSVPATYYTNPLAARFICTPPTVPVLTPIIPSAHRGRNTHKST